MALCFFVTALIVVNVILSLDGIYHYSDSEYSGQLALYIIGKLVHSNPGVDGLAFLILVAALVLFYKYLQSRENSAKSKGFTGDIQPIVTRICKLSKDYWEGRDLDLALVSYEDLHLL